jgi:MscS family membrane protein
LFHAQQTFLMMKPLQTLFLYLTLIALPVFVSGQDAVRPESGTISLSSPHDALHAHIFYLQEDHYDPGLSAQAFLQPGISPEEAEEAAVRLKQVFDGRGYSVNPDVAPREPDYADTLTGLQVYVPVPQLPGIYLQKTNDRWLYSRESIEQIDKLYREVFPFGSDLLQDLLPRTGSRHFVGLYLWQHFGVFLMILFSFLLYKLLSFLFSRVLYQGASRLGYTRLVRPYLLPVARPLSLFVVFIFIVVLFPLLQLPVGVSKYFHFLFRAILPFFATVVFYKLVDVFALYLESIAKKGESSLDNHVIPLIKKVLRVFVVVIGGLFILQNLDVNITALLAGISIGGLALALAAQDTLKNFFGSLMIFIDKPFSVGHWITSGDIDGTVEEVGFRSTRIRTFRNSLTYVPNGKLADSTVDNHGLREFRRFFMNISITYDTPPDLIEVFVQGLRKIVERHPDTRKDFFIVEFNEMSDFSLKIMFYIFFAVPTWPQELKARHEVLIEIVRLAQKMGVRFAFPTSTLHMENFPGKHSLTPHYDMTMAEFKQVMEEYFDKETQRTQ